MSIDLNGDEMNLDLEKALVYISRDPAWVNKLLAGSGILFAMYGIFIIPILLYAFSKSGVLFAISFITSFLISVFLCLIFSGFLAETCNKRINYNNSILPDWKNLGTMLVSGIKYFLGYFLYSVPILLLSFVFLFLITFWIGSPSAFDFQEVFIFILMVVLGATFLSFIIAYLVFCPLMMANFYKDLKILSFVNFKKAWSMLRGHAGSYFVVLLIFLAFSFLLQTVVSILAISIVGIIFIPVVYFYFYLVIIEIVAQFVLETKQE